MYNILFSHLFINIYVYLSAYEVIVVVFIVVIVVISFLHFSFFLSLPLEAFWDPKYLFISY